MTQIWVSDMVLPWHKCTVIASNVNHVVVQSLSSLRLFATPWTTAWMCLLMQPLSKNLFLVRPHTLECICELSLLPSKWKQKLSWKHLLYFDMFMTGYNASPVWAQRTTTYSCLTSWSWCPRIESFKWFQDSVMTKILSLLALSNKIISHFSLQRLLFKLQGNIHHCQSGTSWL